MRDISAKKKTFSSRLFQPIFLGCLISSFLIFTARAADSEKDIRKDIQKVQEEIDAQQRALESSQSELRVTQLEIYTTSELIEKTEGEIKNLEARIALSKKMLSSYVQEMFYNDQEAVSALLLEDRDFSRYLGNFDQMLNVKEKVLAILSEIEADQAELSGKKEEHKTLLAIKEEEKEDIVGDINETQLTISQLQAKMSKLRSTLASFLGKSFSLEDVIEAVELAEKKTGVRKQFLFAVLDKETDLGRYTGGCTYKSSRMDNQNKNNSSIFENICDDLGYDYKKMKVSCAGSGGSGGAMGVAQFMPSTWGDPDCKKTGNSCGYISSISSKTGNNPPDPWSLKDGVMGMALKLKAAGADKKSREHSAAMIYYCGSDHPKETYKGRIASCNNYADTVVSWSKSYEDYF